MYAIIAIQVTAGKQQHQPSGAELVCAVGDELDAGKRSVGGHPPRFRDAAYGCDLDSNCLFVAAAGGDAWTGGACGVHAVLG